MPFGIANAPALFQELLNKIPYILRRRVLIQELVSRGAEMEAHINDVSLGTTPMILWGILRPKPHLRYRTGSETAYWI